VPRFRMGLALLTLATVGATFVLTRAQAKRRPQVGKCRVVVVGGGFGGLHAALELAKHQEVDLTLVDARNHHLFQPLLYQVATAALSPADIAAPLRNVLPLDRRVRFIVGEVSGVTLKAVVFCAATSNRSLTMNSL
jgi:NADH dehydrogenase FAD-containing subunit